MKTALTLACAALLLGACANTPPVPDWQANAFAALGSATSAYLTGNSRVADAEFSRARTEISRTGRPDLMARLELVRCAAQTASLEWGACEAFQKLAADAQPAEQAYAQFLAGRWADLPSGLLPLHYRSLVAQWQDNSGRAPAASGPLPLPEEPLARLIAASLLLKLELLTPAAIGLAADSASNQGWRRPLLAWLGLQLKRAQAAGDAPAAAQLQQRIDLVLSNPAH